ncbi:MAG: hypothetical protein J6C15_03820 [Bacteroidaceae bacterium]|nr:hypothetical protein [Bacteroidaceae bacterium]
MTGRKENKKFSWRKLLLWVLGLIIVCCALPVGYFFFPHQKISHSTVLFDTTGLRNGDLLFRNGNGGESRFVTGISNGIYSHIALAYRDSTGWKAVHAVPGETENVRDTDYLKCEPIEDFYQYERACAGAMARVNCPDSLAERALDYALDKVKRRFAFDHHYKLEDTTTYYCTELIYWAYLTVGINLADDRRHHLPTPQTDGVFVFPSDILSSPHILFSKAMQTSDEPPLVEDSK